MEAIKVKDIFVRYNWLKFCVLKITKAYLQIKFSEVISLNPHTK